ncbi:MAG: hypothetical protein AVDCRST_MAG30-1280 [uncultured Solirubrobacteraceae bacterium]|uniref:Uncharacterized protein n=1 Tax=uncultured Solirubrobacteraceae bacterium TaxID=1162706 RepID=A0A6J4S4K0_9ACTN|nr:MAG: hypothetical protein AVDCRST_MAG30-1280 [uncultured Solirubrobacteraceae bacterium]
MIAVDPVPGPAAEERDPRPLAPDASGHSLHDFQRRGGDARRLLALSVAAVA